MLSNYDQQLLVNYAKTTFKHATLTMRHVSKCFVYQAFSVWSLEGF